MILRVTRTRVIPGHEDQVLDVIRGLAERMRGSVPGLRSASFVRAMDRDQVMSLVSITEWESIDALRAVLGDRWAEGSILPGSEAYVLDMTVEHFETTLEDISVAAPEERDR